MKIAIGYEVVEGPWGGGNAFVRAITSWLQDRGDVVVTNLRDEDIDIILIIDPRSYLHGYTFSAFDVFKYQRNINRNVVVIHRVNECDERKNTRFMNFWLRSANYIADHTLFIADWLRELDVWYSNDGRSSSTVFNGGDQELFYSRGNQLGKLEFPVKLVTHHWGANLMKGFDIYKLVDELLETSRWRERIEFTYIGNVPSGFSFKNVKVIAPLSGKELGNALSEFDGYITGSICEPGGMHHVEAGLTGLPLLYRNSGALPEYCKGFGQIFQGCDDFEVALEKYLSEWEMHKENMQKYPWTLSLMCEGYCDVMDRLFSAREQIRLRRRPFRNPIALFNVVMLHFFAKSYDMRKRWMRKIDV